MAARQDSVDKAQGSLIHEIPASAGSGEGQMYEAQLPSAKRLFLSFKPMKSHVTIEKPYYCTKAHPQSGFCRYSTD